MAASKVRTHTRRTASGGTTTVRQHSRRGRGRALVSPAHAWKLARRAFGAGRRKRRATAVVLGVLALGEITAWLGLEGASLALATAGVLALGVAWLAATAGGIEL